MLAETIALSNHKHARVLRAPEDAHARQVMEALELPAPRALLILNGATAKLDRKVSASLEKLFKALARVVIEQQITILTGGTRAGVFALFGRALAVAGRLTAPCIGVTAGLRVTLTDLEPQHTHFVLVETKEWNAATPVMYRLAEELASRCPSLALFAGGGSVTLREMQYNMEQHREMIMLAGSQGVTDAVAASRTGEPASSEDIRRISRDGRLTVFAMEDAPSALANLISSRLSDV